MKNESARFGVSSVEMWSPAWLEQKIRSLNNRVFASVLAVAEKAPFLFLSIVSLLAVAFFYLRPSVLSEIVPFLTREHASWMGLKIWPIIFLITLGPFLWLARRATSMWVTALVSLATFGFLFLDAPNIISGFTRICAIGATYLVLVVPLLLTEEWPFFVKIIYLVSGVLALNVAEAITLHVYPRSIYDFAFSVTVRWIMPLSLGLLQQHVGGTRFSFKNKETLKYLFSPALFLIVLPVKSEDCKKSAEVLTTMLQGLADVVVGICAFGLCALELSNWPQSNIHGGIYFLWLAGLRISLAHFFCCLGLFRFGSGVGRWLGFALPDNSCFAILATSPVDSWKRWSTYLYNWMLVAIFIPLQRRIKFVSVVFILTFIGLFLLHRSLGVVNLIVFHDLRPKSQRWLLQLFLFFTAHGSLMYFCFRTKALWPNGSRITGWFGVLTTQILLGFVHIFVITNDS